MSKHLKTDQSKAYVSDTIMILNYIYIDDDDNDDDDDEIRVFVRYNINDFHIFFQFFFYPISPHVLLG